MARIVMAGSGIVGMSAAMMLAHDGHEVIALERDPEPPPSPQLAWEQCRSPTRGPAPTLRSGGAWPS